MRRVWGLPNRTHCYLLTSIICDDNVEWQLLSRTVNFIRAAGTSRNKLFFLSGRLAAGGSSSSVSNTMSKISDLLSCNRGDILDSTWKLSGRDRFSCSWKARAIRDFSIARFFASGDDLMNFNEIIIHLCTD